MNKLRLARCQAVRPECTTTLRTPHGLAYTLALGPVKAACLVSLQTRTMLSFACRAHYRQRWCSPARFALQVEDRRRCMRIESSMLDSLNLQLKTVYYDLEQKANKTACVSQSTHKWWPSSVKCKTMCKHTGKIIATCILPHGSYSVHLRQSTTSWSTQQVRVHAVHSSRKSGDPASTKCQMQSYVRTNRGVSLQHAFCHPVPTPSKFLYIL